MGTTSFGTVLGPTKVLQDDGGAEQSRWQSRTPSRATCLRRACIAAAWVEMEIGSPQEHAQLRRGQRRTDR